MRTTLGATTALLLGCAMAAAAGQGSPKGTVQTRLPPKGPYIWVESISVSPTVLHKTLTPNTAVATVKVGVHGRIPPGSWATVDLYTFAADPLHNNVAYGPPATLPLNANPTIFRLKVSPEARTVTGYVLVTAEIRRNPRNLTVWLWSLPHTKLKAIAP